MPDGSSLSKIYTLDDLLKRVLSRAGITDPDTNVKPKIIAELNVQMKNIAQRLRQEKPDIRDLYIQEASITWVSGEVDYATIEIASPLIVEPDRIEATDSTGRKYGTVPFIDLRAFANLNDLIAFDNSIIYTMQGRRLKIFTGRNLNTTGWTYKFYYVRQVNTMDALTDLMDIPDPFIDELVNDVVPIFQVAEKKTE